MSSPYEHGIFGRMFHKRRRNSLRHPGWHYGAAGYYFVTICTAGRECLFDSAEFRTIAETTLQKIPSFKSAATVRIDEWVVMPNHVHLILVIVDGVSAEAERPTNATSGTVGALIGKYKAAVTKRINTLRNDQGASVWQRGYYDHIIRNEQGLNSIRKYIHLNPSRWEQDRDNLERLTAGDARYT